MIIKHMQEHLKKFQLTRLQLIQLRTVYVVTTASVIKTVLAITTLLVFCTSMHVYAQDSAQGAQSDVQGIYKNSEAEETSSWKTSDKGISWLDDVSNSAMGKKVISGLNYFSKKLTTVEIQVEGGHKIGRLELERIIPQEQNLLSWKTSQDELRARFLTHPLVKDVTFSSCHSSQGLDCLKLKIEEEEPRLWVRALSAERPSEHEAEAFLEHRYLIAADGKILAAIRQSQKVEPFTSLDREILAKFTITELSDLPVLDVRNMASVSDASSRIFSRAVEVLNLVEGAFNQKVYQLKFLTDREVEADFELQPYSVVFDLGSGFKNRTLLAAQVKRLNQILKEKPVLATKASKITLGLGKEVVVVL